MPPHSGHLHLITEAQKQVEELTILVCTIQKEPIPGHLRFRWMKSLFPQARVVHVTDEVPSYPHESADFWKIWKALLKRELDPSTEVVFAGEAYGGDIAFHLGIQFEMIDRKNGSFTISGSELRQKPFEFWQFLPKVVRPYFVKKVVLTGPESTGKTMLAQILAEHYQTAWIPEYGRDYFVQKKGELTYEDMSVIASGQLIAEDAKLPDANRLLFCDTDLIVTQIWSEIYFGTCPNDVIEKNDQRQYDLFLLLDVDIPWEDDGTREFPHLRNWHFNRLKEELQKRELPFVVISGSYEERKASAIKHINRYFF